MSIGESKPRKGKTDHQGLHCFEGHIGICELAEEPFHGLSSTSLCVIEMIEAGGGRGLVGGLQAEELDGGLLASPELEDRGREPHDDLCPDEGEEGCRIGRGRGEAPWALRGGRWCAAAAGLREP